jgi:glycosyltransferase involved in cell wall biosynthesis
VVCISEQQKQRVVRTQQVEPEKLFVAHDGVDLASYEGLSTPEARAQLGIDPDERVVMHTGHLYPSKDVETLVRAAADFDAECYIVGGYPEDVSRIKSEVTIPDNIMFTGFVPPKSIPTYQIAVDVLVATVAEDPEMDFFSPLKLFEYMASNTPLVVSRKPAYEEVLTHGRNGLFVEPGSVSDLADSVTRLLSDSELRAALGRRAREDIIQYDWTAQARRILERIELSAAVAEPTEPPASAW